MGAKEEALKKLKIEYIHINEIKPNEYNPKKMSEKEEKDLEESILRFGMVEPLVINGAEERKGILIGGHQRYKIYKRIGIVDIPVVKRYLPNVEDEQELCLRLTKNTGSLDYELLANYNDEMLIAIGFESEELEKHFLDLDEHENAEVDSEYPFGTVNSWVRIGDYKFELEATKYKLLEKRIEEAGGINNFIGNLCLG